MVQKRKFKIGFFLSGDYSWIGGLYYTLNLIKAVSAVSEIEDTKIVVICEGNIPTDIVSELSTLNIKLIFTQYSLLRRGLMKINNILRIKMKNQPVWEKELVDIVYPLFEVEGNDSSVSQEIYWIPDFQHKILPENFTNEELQKRNSRYLKIAESKVPLILSSQDALKDFKQFYPNAICSTYVLNFKSIINFAQDVEREIDLTNWKLVENKYAIVANQFWKHKNHLLVIKSWDEIYERTGIKLCITGELVQNEYTDMLKGAIEKIKNKESIVLTGFLSRKNQLGVFWNAKMVIQPSKFEGWSTVIEDAKTLGIPVLAANLKVNKEQLGKDAIYFSPDNPEEFIEKFNLSLKLLKRKTMEINYKEYGRSITSLLKKINGI